MCYNCLISLCCHFELYSVQQVMSGFIAHMVLIESSHMRAPSKMEKYTDVKSDCVSPCSKMKKYTDVKSDCVSPIQQDGEIH